LWDDGDPTVILLPRPGWWQVGCGVQWEDNGTGIREVFTSAQHYGWDAYADYRSATVGGVTEQYGSGLVYVQSGVTDEQVVLTVNQTSGAPLNLNAYMTAVWLP
jgi:hypothetical protein